MTTKHTPGPWARDTGSGVGCDVRAQNGRKVAATWGINNGDPNRPAYRAECDANARLIAAAPELLDLLSALECDINTLVYCYERKPDNFGRAVAVAKADAERARAAIAKAKGEQT